MLRKSCLSIKTSQIRTFKYLLNLEIINFRLDFKKSLKFIIKFTLKKQLEIIT